MVREEGTMNGMGSRGVDVKDGWNFWTSELWLRRLEPAASTMAFIGSCVFGIIFERVQHECVQFIY